MPQSRAHRASVFGYPANLPYTGTLPKDVRAPMLPESPKPYGDTICDVLVIGGGPAGSTIAALLAERGKTVTLVDKDQHPRFHIGESLLPFNIPLFERLGVQEKIERIGLPKFGIEFVSPDHDKPSLLEFADGWHKDMDYSFQV